MAFNLHVQKVWLVYSGNPTAKPAEFHIWSIGAGRLVLASDGQHPETASAQGIYSGLSGHQERSAEL